MSNELPRSFEQLYLAYYPRVYRWAYRLLHHHEAAQDATQETFLRAWRYLTTFDPAKGALSSWLYRITVQSTIDQAGYRKARLATISLESLPWEVQDREAADPQTRYAGRAEQVAVALEALPDNERLALAMLASGYREVEIARRVGKTPRTVRYWFTSGRKHLAQAMEGER
jgi:RNA polymerase sigma-70 factor (ECF subfamily)